MFKRTLLILVIALFTTTLFAQNVENDSIATYYLIRHAEKDRSNTTNKNPDLTEKGQQRAENWNQLFKKFQIDAVYSTDYKRTLSTALPTAVHNKLRIKTYHPFKINMLQFLKETKGKSVLVVGHSNTTPDFANKLIGKEVYQDINDNNNSNLYIVTIKGEHISYVLVKMK